jgi:preprotein translocase subunit SecG
MIVAITILHVIVSLGLILVVLLQTGKADMGAVFGGSSSTIFGSSGAGNFLTKLTTGMAIVFMMTSLTLGYFAGRSPSSTIFDNRTPASETRPVEPPPAEKQGDSPNAPPTVPLETQPQKSTNP